MGGCRFFRFRLGLLKTIVRRWRLILCNRLERIPMVVVLAEANLSSMPPTV